MNNSDTITVVYLKTGELFWGDKNNRIITTLGSCISICLWHPEKRIGGISHFMVPGRRKRRRAGKLNTKYSDDTMWMFLDKIKAAKTKPSDYVVKIFGGSLFTLLREPVPEILKIGKRNAAEAQKILEENGFTVSVKHLGGTIPRTIYFDLWNGNVWLKKFRKSFLFK